MVPPRPKIGDTKPAPLSKASEGVPASTGNGRKAQASPAGQPTELHGAGDDGTASAAPGTGSSRRRRGGRGQSRGAGAASVEAAVEANAVGSDGSRAEGASPGRTSAPHEARARGATSAQTRRGSTVPAVPVQPPSASGPVPGVDAPVQRLTGIGGAGRSVATSCASTSSMKRPTLPCSKAGRSSSTSLPARKRHEPDCRQHLPRASEERASRDGGGLCRHRHTEERGPLLG